MDARTSSLLEHARGTRGFMPDDEGLALWEAARRAGQAFEAASFVEIGAWCGKSTLYLGAAAEATGAVLFSLDHHHGSEENQAGWDYYEADLVDPVDGRLNTLPHWQRAVSDAGLESTVVGMVGDSPTIATLLGAARLLFHRRGARVRAGVGRLPGLGAARGGRRVVGHSRRLRRPGGGGAAPVRVVVRRAVLARLGRGRRVRVPPPLAPPALNHPSPSAPS